MLTAVFLAAGCDGPSPESAGDTASGAIADPQGDPSKIHAADGRTWFRLKSDGLHDPDNPVLEFLQQPAEALGALPRGGPDGNQVDWAEALRSGAIDPRTNVLPDTPIRVLDLDIEFRDTAGQPYVVFPHRQHTEWLDCDNCHPKFFVAKRGANDISMFDVLQGEFCGRCHGAVSFPLTECKRCHSKPWQ